MLLLNKTFKIIILLLNKKIMTKISKKSPYNKYKLHIILMNKDICSIHQDIIY